MITGQLFFRQLTIPEEDKQTYVVVGVIKMDQQDAELIGTETKFDMTGIIASKLGGLYDMLEPSLARDRITLNIPLSSKQDADKLAQEMAGERTIGNMLDGIVEIPFWRS